MSTLWRRIATPLGPMLALADDETLLRLDFEGPETADRFQGLCAQGESDVLTQAARELGEYFAGERTDFTVPINPSGTEFRRRVWDELVKIPFGEVISYGILAQRVGDAKAVRAVGGANGANPISVVIPCHRVVASDGTLGGYGGGLERKRALLDLERGVSPGATDLAGNLMLAGAS